MSETFCMMLNEENPVPQAALPVDAFKAHLRLGSGFAGDMVQDEVLESFLRAAIAAIEARTGKILLTRGFVYRLAEWRDPEAQPLPVAPVTAVTGVSLLAEDGNETVLSAEGFRLLQDSQRPRLLPAGTLLPDIPRRGAVEIAFEAGFAPNWEGLPPDLAQAVLMLAAHYYEYRHETSLGGGCMPFGVTSLIERYRNVRLMPWARA